MRKAAKAGLTAAGVLVALVVAAALFVAVFDWSRASGWLAAQASERLNREVTLGDLEVDSAERRVRRKGELVHLTPTEFDLLLCLAAEPRVVLTREKLLAEVWDWVDASGTRTVDSHVKALRRKLDREQPDYRE